MNKKNKGLFILAALLLVVNTYYYILPYFTKSTKNLELVASDVSINTSDLIKSYQNNENKANILYNEKIVEVRGFVKEVSFVNNRSTVLLYSKDNSSGVICDVNKSQIKKIKLLKEHQEIIVKGICKGFLKDVVLLNCYIDLNFNE